MRGWLEQAINSGRIALLSAGVIVAAFGQGGPARADEHLDHVALQLKWQHQFQFAGYYQAVAQGYYRDAGLSVELREAVPQKDPLAAVLEGSAEFGVGNSDLLLMKQRGYPVVVLADIFQHSPLVLLVRQDRGISDLQDLHDKRIMMIPSESAEIFALFKYEGIDPSRLKVVPHTLNLEDFVKGKVDAVSGYSTDEPFALRQRGVPYFTFTPRSGGIDFYGDNLFTTADQIARHPDRVKAFRAASLRGWDYAMAHLEETVDLIRRDYSQRKTRDGLLFEAQQSALLMHPELIEIGHMNAGRWRHMADTYAEFGMLPAEFSLAGFLYDPSPRPNLAWLYWATAVSAAAALCAVGWILPVTGLNRRLRHEVAERAKAEEQARIARDSALDAQRSKDRYLAVMTHEVRTLLGGIYGFIELLRGTTLNEEQRDYTDTIGESAKSLLILSNDVLDYSKIETGHVQLELMPVELAEFVGGVCDFFREGARAKGLVLRSEISRDAPPMVTTDPTRLRQILSNLISNAVKFTATGEVVVQVGATLLRHEPPQPRVWSLRFLVRDTGIGIAAENLPRLFSAYEQADTTVTRRFGGTGLGLMISKRLAELMGGGVTVESRLGEGTTFTVTIEAAECPPVDPAAAA